MKKMILTFMFLTATAQLCWAVELSNGKNKFTINPDTLYLIWDSKENSDF